MMLFLKKKPVNNEDCRVTGEDQQCHALPNQVSGCLQPPPFQIYKPSYSPHMYLVDYMNCRAAWQKWVDMNNSVIYHNLYTFYLIHNGLKSILKDHSNHGLRTHECLIYFAAQIQIPIPNKYLDKGLVFCRHDGWIIKRWTRDPLYQNGCW